MTSVLSFRPRALLLLLLATSLSAVAHASTARAQMCGIDNLVADWSDAANPNGVWSYRAGTTNLPHVDSWQRTFGGWTFDQEGWAFSEDGNTRIPFWFQSNGSEDPPNDYAKCDVVVHTQDDTSGVGSGQAVLVWTAPADGIVTVDGAVWMARDIGRSNDWKLFRNDTLLTQGSLASGDIYSRSSPFFFKNGSGGTEAIRDIEVATGDTIRLELVRTGQFGDFVGVKMRVLCGAVPDTTTTTSTTLVDYPGCGDAVEDEDIKASDALQILKSAVGQIECLPCVCDTNANGSMTASDALAALRVAVGQPVTLTCEPCPCF